LIFKQWFAVCRFTPNGRLISKLGELYDMELISCFQMLSQMNYVFAIQGVTEQYLKATEILVQNKASACTIKYFNACDHIRL
jgi:hypothetical protein